MLFNVTICGIPASVDIHSVKYTHPDNNASSDWDYYGGWSLDYTICDQRGREAPWLLKKLDVLDIQKIEEQIIQKMGYSEQNI